MEGSIAVLAAARRKEINIRKMRDAVELMDSDELEVQMKADMEFHNAMTNAAYNKTLSDIILVLSDIFSKNLQYNRIHLYKIPGAKETLYKLHKTVFHAIVDGDGENARKALEESLDFAYELTYQFAHEPTVESKS